MRTSRDDDMLNCPSLSRLILELNRGTHAGCCVASRQTETGGSPPVMTQTTEDREYYGHLSEFKNFESKSLPNQTAIRPSHKFN